MTIEQVRERMNLVESYSDPTPGDYGMDTTFQLSVYRTSRPGVYGYQFAAILWAFEDSDSPFVSSLTGGCGYNKVSHCTEEILAKLASERGFPSPYQWEATKLAGSNQLFKALAYAFDVPPGSIYFVCP